MMYLLSGKYIVDLLTFTNVVLTFTNVVLTFFDDVLAFSKLSSDFFSSLAEQICFAATMRRWESNNHSKKCNPHSTSLPISILNADL